MRLTLRTLLAYLDDRLPPANAREIGQKIKNSPFATELVDRIREVKRKRRLASPAKPQPMIDANLVAEYLDDQLTPELVARVEREILASDPMLAEVASAHEILGLIREPVNAEPRLFDRLYGMDPTGNTDFVRALVGPARAGGSTGSETPQWKPLASRVASSRRLPFLLAVLLALVWVYVVGSDSDLFGPQPVSVEEAKLGPPVAADEAGEEVNVAQADKANGAEGSVPAVIAENSGPAEASPDTREPAEAVIESAVAEPGALQPADVPASAAEGDTVAAAAPAKLPEKAVPATEPEKPADLNADAVAAAAGKNAVSAEPSAFYLQADSRIVLAFEEEQNRWIELSQIPGGEAVEPVPNIVNCEPLLGKKWFGVPEQFRAKVAMDSAGWSAALIGPALVRLKDGSPGGLDLLSGRLRLTADPAIAWNDQTPVTFALGTGSQNSVLTLQTAESRVAVEVLPVAPPADSVADRKAVAPVNSTLPLDADLYAQLTVLEGSIRLKSPGSDGETLLTKGQRASWVVLEMQEFSSLAIDNGLPIAAAPAWLFDENAPEIPEQLILKKHLLDALGRPIDPGDSVLPLLTDRNPQVGVLAVLVLSLTRDADRLLSVLFETHDESIHRAAIDGLSAIANSSPAGRAAIRTGLETRLPMAEIDVAAQLIQGITDVQAADPRVVQELMALLGNERLSSRTLAIYRMEQFTRDRMGFHPEAEASRRRDAIRRWQKYVDRNGGRLVPEPQETAP